jgi:protein-disulfide isomerase
MSRSARPLSSSSHKPLLLVLALALTLPLGCRSQRPQGVADPPPASAAAAPGSPSSALKIGSGDAGALAPLKAQALAVPSAELAQKHAALIDPAVERFKVPLGAAATAGSPAAQVTVVAFTDYQCPFCSRADATVAQLQKDYGKNLRVALKHNPLPFHPQAAPAAHAVLAALEQGPDKFWAYHHRLFEDQSQLGPELYEQLAKEVGLDVKQWKADLEGKRPQYGALISGDQALAAKLGAHGTPSFFINGRALQGAQPADSFRKIIDEELGRAERLLLAGVPAEQIYAVLLEGAKEAAPRPAPAARPAFKLPDPDLVYRIPLGSAPSRGPATAKVTIVEYTDFQCPFCARVSPTLDKLRTEFGNDVRVVVKNLPLDFHNSARLAAQAAMAAHEQGRFWAYHDKLFENQQALGRDSLVAYAQEIGLDMKRWKAALDSPRIKARVDADLKEAGRFGARGTPTFFFNGKQVNGAQPYENFEKVVRSEIELADALLKAGTSPAALYTELTKKGRDSAPRESDGKDEDRTVHKVSLGSAPVRGPADAKVTLVLWTDYQCPFCSRLDTTLGALLKRYPRDLRIVVRNMPLSFHHNAHRAAEAALAAQEQGKFWPMHDKLFANQSELDRADLERYARELGLDLKRFNQALDDGRFRQQVDDDIAEAGRLGVTGTPASYINGRLLSGAFPQATFEERIDEAKRDAEALMKKRRIPASRVYAEIMKDAVER